MIFSFSLPHENLWSSRRCDLQAQISDVQWTFFNYFAQRNIFIALLCILIESIDSIENVEIKKTLCIKIIDWLALRKISNKSLDFNSLRNFHLFQSRTMEMGKTRINAEKSSKSNHGVLRRTVKCLRLEAPKAAKNE